MPEIDRQREKGAAGMVERHESRMRDDIERLLAAIIRMHAPADIGEQTGGVTQALFFGRLIDAGTSP